MTKIEFEQRMSLTVSEEEYGAISKMFDYCECGMDAFCRLWAKMNSTRVAKAKAMARRRAIAKEITSNVRKAHLHISENLLELAGRTADECLSIRHKKALLVAGIEFEGLLIEEALAAAEKFLKKAEA